MDIWNTLLSVDPRTSVVVDADEEFVGPNANNMRSFLSSLGHQSRNMSLHHSDWKQVPVEKKKNA